MITTSTCIVGLVAPDGSVWMGGDSAGVSGYSLHVRSDPKVFHNGPFLMGFTTSFRMGQLLRYAFTPPEQLPSQSDYGYMVTTFITAVRQCLRAGGWGQTVNGQESGGTFLVGYRGHLYRICDDFQVGEDVVGYAAVGCGEDFALGSLHATPSMEPRERVELALKAAEQFSAGVRGPFTIEHQGAK